MKLALVSIAVRTKSERFDTLTSDYAGRVEAYAPIEIMVFKTSESFFDSLDRQKSRMGTMLVLLDPRGKQLSSADLAGWIGKKRDEGQQHLVFAIGPADGWSDAERARANLLLSLGPMTLPHELARVVLSEQIYRAFTILSGHPYHTGH
ncbi:23S rRNA (pseudouridine1915-N3)-methyltransferase [Silvibacterium bohemicum]|uniref:Ribosomal RNA large subunit methyltransferase H n=1 Tax=Silvibacterium bohemicum TaxID=1577686 RepID=A0A841JYY7_9BACT|nr:23S rRNA (pseudouridine(1915)-N(3))-methyltransferase RlmH [Silvibacterium bohemicum]MBB6145617.1 23S rRNA (pseudouridine1915-N3)-methyltransferase [Silvibacterium bohemicum]